MWCPARSISSDYTPGLRHAKFATEPYEARTTASDEARKPLEWEEAQTIAVRLMAEQAQKFGFEIRRPIALYCLRDAGLYNYRVRSNRGIGDKYGATGVDFDAYSGELVNVSLPTGAQSGITVTTWLMQLHMAHVFGRPYQLFVCLLGLAITVLSATGVLIWWKKRHARNSRLLRARPDVSRAIEK